MPSIRLGSATLSWDRETATLAHDNGSTDNARPSEGGLRDAALATSQTTAVLATRGNALLVDAAGVKITEVIPGGEIKAAGIVENAALIVNRDLAVLYKFDGTELGRNTPGGAFRPELKLAVMDKGIAAAFHDSFAIFNAAGATQAHLVKSQFPIFRAVGGWAVGAARDFIVTAEAANPASSNEMNSNGGINPAMSRFSGDIGALAARDTVYIINGQNGAINEAQIQGAILSIKIEGEIIKVDSAGNNHAEFDRNGNEV